MTTRLNLDVLDDDTLLTRAQLRELVGISDMALWRWLKKGVFPAPIRLERRRYWRAADLRRWFLDQRERSKTESDRKAA
ncbi:MAG: helix-turn-helix domain-containing protein [Candidatus Riflebacteria bacterium]|nr:helix-turn-helix domain-containing protein [Candidatus Riflebacteria bacterium]